MACVSSSSMTSSTSANIMAAIRAPFASPLPRSNGNNKANINRSRGASGSLKECQLGNQDDVPAIGAPLQQNMSFANAAASMKSPITTCFERMLGAAQVIAQQEAVTIPNNKENGLCHNIREGQPVSASTKPKSKQASSRSRAVLTSNSGENGSNVISTGSAKRERQTEYSESSDDSNDPFQRIAASKSLYRQVVLAMALQKNTGKERDGSEGDDVPPHLVISDGFFWKDYPVCEQVLFDAMPSYYELSIQARQSKHQQKFNNDLVRKVRVAATEKGFSFAPTFSDKKLRDRIRCFFKTHLQNAKKRLCTMQKRSQLAEHQAALRALLEVIDSSAGPLSQVSGFNGEGTSDDDEEEHPRKLPRSK